MAQEFTRLVKIGIDESFIKASIANADRLAKSIDELKQTKKEEGKLSAEQEGRLKALTAERNKNIQVVKQANLLTTTTIKGQEKLKAQLSVLTAQYNKLTTEEQNNTKEGQRLQKQILDTTNELKANEKAVGNNRRNVGNYESALEGVNGKLDAFGAAAGKMPGPLGAMASGIAGATKASLAFIATPLGAVLAAIVLTVKALQAAFTSSEEGQNRWNKIMSVTDALLGNVNDLLADFGELIIDAVSNPKQAIKDFGELIKNNIQNRIEGLLELLPALGKAIDLALSGEFAEAGEVALNAVTKVSLGVEDLTGKIDAGIEKTKEFIAEQEREAKLAADVADMRAKADIVERQLLQDRAKLESKVAELRLKARKEDEFSNEERKKFLVEANKIQDDILNKETEYLTLRRDAIQLENTFSKTNKENKDKEAEAIAAVSRVEATRFTQQRQIQRELNTINNQIVSETKKRTAEEKKVIQEAQEATAKGYQEERKLIDQQAQYQIDKAEIEIDNAEQRSERIAFIEREALLEKLRSIEDETVAYTASADMIGAVDEEKYAKQLAERAKYEAQLAAIDREAKADEFNREMELLQGREELANQRAEIEIENVEERELAKQKIALNFLNERLALMEQSAMVDDVLTEKEIQNLQKVRNEIELLQNRINNPDNKTIADMIGLSEEGQEKLMLGMEVVSSVLQSVQQATQQATENKLAGIDQELQAEINAINSSKQSEENKEKAITKAEQKAAKERYRIELQQFKTAKALQIALAVANTATAVMAQLSNPTPYAGFVLAALAAATGAVQIATIASQKPPPPPAFASGGKVLGAGTGTSDSIPARLSNGEAVINAKSTKMFEPMLSAMNAAGGGVDWYNSGGYAKGGLVRKFAAGGVARSSGVIMRENEAQAELQQTVLQAQPVLIYQDFEDVQGRVIRTEQNLQI